MKKLLEDFFAAANDGNLEGVKAGIDAGLHVDVVQAATGLTAFHYAVGRDHLELARFLVTEGAACLPDRSGRWPSLIAAICEVSEEMCDFVVDEEVKWDNVPPTPQPRMG